jgi:hypothetical protein
VRENQIQTAAHTQQIADANLAARIILALPLPLPFFDGREVIHPQAALPHQHADERGGDTFALRPTDLRRVFGPAWRVTLTYDLAAIDQDDRPRIVLLLRHAPFERGLHNI